MTLSDNAQNTRLEGIYGALPAAAAAKIYQGAICTINSDGYIPDGGFTLGDQFVGHCDALCDNTDGSAGDLNVCLLAGPYRLEVPLAVNLEDVARSAEVYATANDTLTLDPGGASGANTPVGHLVRWVDATYAEVEFVPFLASGSAAAPDHANKIHYLDDFIGYQGVFTTETGSVGPWVGSVVGSATVAAGADIHGGAAVLTIAADDEAQDANLYHGDQLNFDIDLLEEFNARFKVATPGTGVRVVFGMAGNHNADKDTVAQSAWFSLDAGLALKAETDDGSENNDDKTIDTIVTNTWYDAKIDFRDPTDVKFFLDGDRVATGTTFDMSNYTGGLQPYMSADKASGTGTATLTVDFVDVIANRG